jgi:hypothetical protein
VALASCSATDERSDGSAPLPPPPAADTSIPTPPPASGDAVADSGDPSTWMVTEMGIGPLRAGMTRTQVEAAIDTSLDATPPSEGSCVMTPLPGAPAGTALMMVGDTLVRVDVFRSSTTRTAAGAKLGDSAARIDSLYPGRVHTQPHKYTTGKYLIVPSPADSTFRFVFETDEEGRVTRYRSGRLPEVEWVEACS